MSVANFRKEKHSVLMSAAYSSIFSIILSYRLSIPWCFQELMFGPILVPQTAAYAFILDLWSPNM